MVLAAAGMLFGCSQVGDATDAPSRAAAFQELFGFPVTSDVSSVTSSWYRSGSLYIRRIRVGCGPRTIELIRSQKRVDPSHYQIFQAAPGAPHPPTRNVVPKLWSSSLDAIPKWWTDAADMPKNPGRFTLGWQTSSKQDLVFVWLDASAGVVYAARNVSEYNRQLGEGP